MEDAKKKKPAAPANIHANHRERMRKRFRDTGLTGFQDHEVLELLLFYAIPRRNVNPLAHLLMNRFGSLSAVLDATEEELLEVPGVGKRVAQQLQSVPAFVQHIMLNKLAQAPQRIETAQDIARLMLPLFSEPQFFLVLMKGDRDLIGVRPLDDEDFPTLRAVLTEANAVKAQLLALVECTDLPISDAYARRLPAFQTMAADVDQSGLALFFDGCIWSQTDRRFVSCRSLGGLPFSG